MSIGPDSRYKSGRVEWVDHPTKGRVQVVHLFPPRWRAHPFTLFQASIADDFWYLAEALYGDAEKYWFIAEMNPRVACPDDLGAGEILRLPQGLR